MIGAGDADRLGSLLDGKTTYERWVDAQGIPRIKDFYVKDVNRLKLQTWQRKGGKGAFLNLEGTEETNDAYVCEIPAGGQLNPDRHLYEEIIYVLKGKGATKVWQKDMGQITFEWHEGSLFAIPLNAYYQHFNGSGTENARIIAVTSAPLVMNLFHDVEFVFDCPYGFLKRFSGAEVEYFNGNGTLYGERIWETNFIPDVQSYPLIPRKERGRDANCKFELAYGSLTAHVSEFPVGRYKKAHRHGPGAHVIILAGEGFSLLWREGEKPSRYDWQPGSVIVPPDMWFHQHFNTGREPARYLALRWGSRKFHVFKDHESDRSMKEGGNQIEYQDQNPDIHAMYLEELAKEGIRSQMEEFS